MSSISSLSLLTKENEYKELVSIAFNSCLPYINELYPNLVQTTASLGLLQQRTLIKTILAVATNTIDDNTCIKIDRLLKFELNDLGTFDPDSIPPFGKVKQTIISVWQGNIVRLEVDAIVNAVSNPYCLGCNIPLHNCVDNTIHSFAGPRLRNESKFLLKTSDEWKKPINTGECRVTKAHCLPCKYVIHTKGPTCQEPSETDRQQLANCYINSLNTAKLMGLRTIAFCCISTGLHTFESELSARIAIDTVKSYLEKIENLNSFDLIVFAVSTSKEFKSYMNNQNIMLSKNSLLLSTILGEQQPKKKILLPLSALKGLHYPWVISDESEKIESQKESDVNNWIDLHSLKLSTSIEGAREHFLNKLDTEKTWKESEEDSELDIPDLDKLNLLKLNSSMEISNKSRSDEAEHTVLASDSKDVMNDAMDTKYDWILLTLNSGTRMQQAILNDLSANVSDSDSNDESSYLKKLSNIYKPDLSVMQYIIGCTKLSTKLSSIWRGYQQKQKFKFAILSIRRIQRVYKRYYIREKLIKCRIELRMLRFKSIVKIQTIWRKYICRQKFLKMYIELSIHKSVQNYAIVKISSLYRGYNLRKKISIYLYAIIVLQSFFRMKNRRYYFVFCPIDFILITFII
jgi:O-acetyl-ADP-ribose deacetylase (regulator of RNase III)